MLKMVVFGVRAHNRGESFTVARHKEVAGRIGYGLSGAGEGGGKRYIDLDVLD
jgi:hypothetical protein